MRRGRSKLGFALYLGVVGCTPIATDSAPTASERGLSSPSESAAPLASPLTSETPLLFPNIRLAVVRVNALNVRTAPSTSAPVLGDDTVEGSPPISLDAGNRVLVIGDPVDADGIRWFAVGPEEDPTYYARPLTVGWAAAGTPSDPWIDTHENGPCALQPTVTELRAMPGIVRVGCYGDAPLAFDAYQAAHPGGLGGLCLTEAPLPRWLICDNINYNWVNADGSTTWLFLLHFDPRTGIPETGLADMGTSGFPLHITRHFRDQAADSCVHSSDPESAEAMGQWLTCAARFVVESIEFR